MESYTTQNWYSKITQECNGLAEKFGLDDFSVREMRDFVMQVARDQFKSGSKSGFRYAKRGGGDKTLVAAPEAVAA